MNVKMETVGENENNNTRKSNNHKKEYDCYKSTHEIYQFGREPRICENVRSCKHIYDCDTVSLGVYEDSSRKNGGPIFIVRIQMLIQR